MMIFSLSFFHSFVKSKFKSGFFVSALRAPWGSADVAVGVAALFFSACALTWFFCFCKESLRIRGFNTAFLSCWFWSVVVLWCSAHAYCQLLEAARGCFSSPLWHNLIALDTVFKVSQHALLLHGLHGFSSVLMPLHQFWVQILFL